MAFQLLVFIPTIASMNPRVLLLTYFCCGHAGARAVDWGRTHLHGIHHGYGDWCPLLPDGGTYVS